MSAKRVAIVGGVPCRLTLHVPGVDFCWFGSARDVGDGELRRLCAAIEAGQLDLVIVLARFVGHGINDKAKARCRRAGVQCWVRPGGVSGILAEVGSWLASGCKKPVVD